MPYCFEHQRISGPGPIDNQRISDLGPQTRDVLDGHSDLDPRCTGNNYFPRISGHLGFGCAGVPRVPHWSPPGPVALQGKALLGETFKTLENGLAMCWK